MQTSGVDNTYRRKWNKDEFLERARERDDKDQDGDRHRSKGRVPHIQRKPLKHRDYEVDLTSRLGKTQVVTQVAPLSQQAGYYCSVCECVVKDSANYLDHINGKKHQRALGMSMRVERATLKQVQERFDSLKRRKTDFTEQGWMTTEKRGLLPREEKLRLQCVKSVLPPPIVHPGYFEGGVVFLIMAGYALGNQQQHMPGTMFEDQFGMPQGNFGMAGISNQQPTMASTSQNVSGHGVQMAPNGVSMLETLPYDNLTLLEKPKAYKEGGQAVKFKTISGFLP
ncbi:hypothetical protein L7F22_062093 [Adiantum nelumboides]|nr:hypothetical protein [Adiantum nelumboides]